MNSMKIYLLINVTLYDNDQKKIVFALSFTKEGSTATWTSTTTKDALARDPPSFGTWATFYDDFKTSFIHANTKNEAIVWLTTTMVSKTLPLGDYISQFNNYAALSEINNGDAVVN